MPNVRATWVLRERAFNRQYLQSVTPSYAEWTFKRGHALRFLTKEAALREREGWIDPAARASFMVVKLTTRVGTVPRPTRVVVST